MTQFASTLYPQTNPTNPILLAFRDDVELNPTIPVSHLSMIWADRDMFAFEVQNATLGHARHARRVLTRLANFSG